MAWYPGAVRRPIKPGPNDPPIKVIGAILHVDAGNSKSLFGYFSEKSGGIESHFHIPKAGRPEQYRDTGYEADANLKANSFMNALGERVGFVSIETQGLATGTWNAHQVDEIHNLLIWLANTHEFPLRVCQSSTSPGVGYHTMWGAPGPWTPVAKDCPGKDRVRQFEKEIRPWLDTVGKPPAPKPPTGLEPGKVDDLANADEVMAELRKFQSAELARYGDVRGLLQKLYDAEAGRYKDYTDRLTNLSTAIGEVEQRLSDAGIE